MDRQRLTLLLLPGMDGTGELFAHFVKLLPDWVEPLVVSYPRDQKLRYDQLLPILKMASPPDEPFVVLAESFSTPLAVMFAAEHPKGLRALVLCAGFVVPPRRDVLALLTLVLAPMLFSFVLPKIACRYFLVGGKAPMAVVDQVRAAVSGVPGHVLADRFKSVLSCNVERDLRSVSIPLLYVSGNEDRLVRIASFERIRKIDPDASLATVEAPHLIVQSKPHEVIDAVLPILQKAWGAVAK